MRQFITVADTGDLANTARVQSEYVVVDGVGLFQWQYEGPANGTTIFTASNEPFGGGGFWRLLFGEGGGGGNVSIPATEYADNATALAALGAGSLYKSTTYINGSPIILITI